MMEKATYKIKSNVTAFPTDSDYSGQEGIS